MLVEIQMFIFYVLIYSYFFYHDCIFSNFYSNAAHKFPVYGTIKFYCIVLYCIRKDDFKVVTMKKNSRSIRTIMVGVPEVSTDGADKYLSFIHYNFMNCSAYAVFR